MMPLDAEQREALRLELLLKANERDRWINDHYRKLDAVLLADKRAREKTPA